MTKSCANCGQTESKFIRVTNQKSGLTFDYYCQVCTKILERGSKMLAVILGERMIYSFMGDFERLASGEKDAE